MTVNTATPASGPYASDGVNRSWGYGFKAYDAAHLNLVLTAADGSVQVLTSGFQVSGLGQDTGGTVTYPVAPAAPLAAGYSVTVLGAVPYSQGTSLGNQVAYFPKIHEQAFDLVVMMVKQLVRLVGRQLALRPGDADGTGKFDAKGNGITGLAAASAPSDAVRFDQISDAVTAAGQAASSATAAAGSASSAAASATAAQNAAGSIDTTTFAKLDGSRKFTGPISLQYDLGFGSGVQTYTAWHTGTLFAFGPTWGGLVPNPGGATGRFLRDDGSFASIPAPLPLPAINLH